MIATCSALASVIIQGGGALFVNGFGVLIDLHSNPTDAMANVNEYATAADFTFAFWMLPIAYAITAGIGTAIAQFGQRNGLGTVQQTDAEPPLAQGFSAVHQIQALPQRRTYGRIAQLAQ